MDSIELARRVRQACEDAARAAFEDAGMQGLCCEGRWEAALGAMRALDPAALAARAGSADARDDSSRRAP